MDEETENAAPELDLDDGGSEAEVPEDDESEDAEGDADDDSDSSDTGGEQGGDHRPQNRANSRIRALSAEKKAALERENTAKREIETLRREMEEVRRSVHTSTTVRDTQAEAAILADMDPLSRLEYVTNNRMAAMQADLQRARLEAADGTDKAQFLSEIHNDPSLSKHVPNIERDLAAMRARGMNAPRKDLLAYYLGKSLLEQKSKSGGRTPEKRAAQARVESTQGRSTSVRSDSSAGRRGKTAEERLENMML